ncbi:hypothetical protein SY88_09140 [Clostridiales bacterium PH28_bin88]|nr:hypothetical protein SY88_09140 [Clostridiales bacterium PH28_bin88]
MKKVIRGLAVLSVVSLLVFLAGCGGGEKPQSSGGAQQKQEEKVIKMGVLAPLTGNIATFGQEQKNAVEMRVKEINDAGGILGYKIKLFVEDDENKPEMAATVTQKLINEGVSVIIGGMSSSSTMSAAPIAQRAKVLMISPWSTNPKATSAGNYIFRACFSDDFQGAVQARYAVEKLGAKRIAQLLDVSNDGSKGQGEVFQKVAKELGAEMVAVESFSGGDKDFKAQLTKIKGQNPQLLDLPSYYAEDALIAKQARELGLNIPLLGGDGNDSADLFTIGGSAIEGFVITNHYSSDDPRPEVQEFRKKYESTYKAVPGAGAALSYDAVTLYKLAVEKAGVVENEKVRDALEGLKDVNLITAPKFSFDANRNGVKGAAILEAKGGKWVFKDYVNP